MYIRKADVQMKREMSNVKRKLFIYFRFTSDVSHITKFTTCYYAEYFS